MSVLNVFLATAGPAQGVRDALADLSAAGLIEPFVWIDAATPDAATPGAAIPGVGSADGAALPGSAYAGARVPCIEVADGRTRAGILQEILAGRSRELIRLCVLVPLSDSAEAVPGPEEHAIAGVLESGGGTRLIRLRMLMGRKDDVPHPSAAPTRAGWHNLLLSPEDSMGPGKGRRALTAAEDIVDFGRTMAPVVAGTMGLWSGAGHAPFDSEQPLPGAALRVVRSFYRRLDSAQAEDGLRRRLLDVDTAMPLPRDSSGQAIYVDDVQLANHTMAESLWRKHRDVLVGDRVPEPADDPSREIGMAEALRMFFSFLGATLRNAPMAWYTRLTSAVSSSVASAVHKTVFGSADSAYTVVVNGVSADGSRAGWKELISASQSLGTALDADGGRTHRQQADLTELWRDYVSGALTLVDAGERSPGLPPVQIGASRAVLRRAGDAVPGPEDRFTDIPGIVGAGAHVSELEPTDPMGIHDMQQRLQSMEKDQALSLDAQRTGNSVAQWLQRVRTSYGYRFGEILARELFTATRDVGTLLARLEAASRAEDPGAEVRRHQRRLALWSQAISGFAVGALIAAVVSWAMGFIPLWWPATTIIAATIVAWVVILLIVFARGQQELFWLLNEKRRTELRVEVDHANLRTVLRDVDRLALAYRQHGSWSRALGAFLARPLGELQAGKTGGRRIGWGLPLNASVGDAAPGAEAVDTVVTFLRRDLFRVGWLREPWTALVEAAASGTGGEAAHLRHDPQAIWRMPGADTGSALDVWSTRVRAGEVVGSGGVVLWERASDALRSGKRELATRLVEEVETGAGASARRQPFAEFMAGVGVQLSEADAGRFDNAVFSDIAQTRGLAEVERTWATVEPHGLGMVAVTTQCSAGMSAEALRLFDAPVSVLGGVGAHSAGGPVHAGPAAGAGPGAGSAGLGDAAVPRVDDLEF